jgi:hypothetical protein
VYTIVVLFEDDKMRGVSRLRLLATVKFNSDEVALRSVQNIPAIVGTGEGSVNAENSEFMRL